MSYALTKFTLSSLLDVSLDSGNRHLFAAWFEEYWNTIWLLLVGYLLVPEAIISLG